MLKKDIVKVSATGGSFQYVNYHYRLEFQDMHVDENYIVDSDDNQLK
jgi:hypothetical protein